jgi:hypothetical protein
VGSRSERIAGLSRAAAERMRLWPHGGVSFAAPSADGVAPRAGFPMARVARSGAVTELDGAAPFSFGDSCRVALSEIVFGAMPGARRGGSPTCGRFD